jgi:hypothetical protein
MTLNAEQEGNLLKVNVTITNTEAGHHVPTDHPGRHLILTIEATGPSGTVLQQVGGGQAPSWAGDQAGHPGKAYAKVLQDVQTGDFPVVSYWKQSLIKQDNRIPAQGEDESVYYFALPATADAITVRVTLRFRRLYADVADEKAWAVPDILMEEETMQLQIVQNRIFYPLIF